MIEVPAWLDHGLGMGGLLLLGCLFWYLGAKKHFGGKEE